MTEEIIENAVMPILEPELIIEEVVVKLEVKETPKFDDPDNEEDFLLAVKGPLKIFPKIPETRVVFSEDDWAELRVEE